MVDLFIGGDSVVWDVDVVVVEFVWDVFAVIELAAVDHGFDAVVTVKLEDIWVWPPRGGDFVFDDPGEWFCSFWLAFRWPVPWSDWFRHDG